MYLGHDAARQNAEQGKTLADWGDVELTQLLAGLIRAAVERGLQVERPDR